MNQTQDPTNGTDGPNPSAASGDAGSQTGEQPGQQARNQGPRITRDQAFDIERLRRSSSDKYVAGVAGGLGRHLDIDPLVVRVVFAVTAIFGVGILLYGALWLLVPDDHGQAAVDTTPETRKVLVIVAVALSGAMLLGAVFGDSWGIFPVALLGLAGVAIYAAIRNRNPRHAQPGSVPVAGPHPGSQDPDYYRPDRPVGQGDEPTRVYETAVPAGSGGPHGPGGDTAWNYSPPPARKPRRSGPILFWPTLAVLAIALGSLAIYDLDNPVAAGAYAALSLGIVGVALVIGAFFGRAGGLILVGLIALPPLLVTTAIGNDFTRSSGSVTESPTRAVDVRPSYDIHSGQLRLDLSGLPASELAQLDGRTIDIDMSAGEVVVTLPANVGYDIDAQLRFAGEVRVLDRVSNGMNPSLDDVTRIARTGEPTISLDIEGVVGRLEVTQEGLSR